MIEKPVFKPRARLILQLGDELIKNESIALLELVKNSYDAGANHVEIRMKKLDDPDKGEISILDDGCGMNEEIINEAWLEPGSDYKKTLLEKKKWGEGRFYRKPLGEKGIGRFSVHKLGRSIKLVSRMEREEEIVIEIDWTEFEKAKYIDQVPINIRVRKPEFFTGAKTGTFIKIHQLRPGQWLDDKTILNVFRSINAISSPFETVDAFRVSINTDRDDLLKRIPSIAEIKQSALYKFKCEMEGKEITKFSYKFTPYASMKLLKQKVLTYDKKNPSENTFEKFDQLKEMVFEPVRSPGKEVRKSVPIDLSQNGMKIGKVKFQGLIFARGRKILKYAETDTAALTKYLDQNGGVRVYRDGIRVYDYGEPENDWLDMEKSRVYEPGVKLNRTLILAAVHLDRAESVDLIEKTNREGFVENDAYRALKNAVLAAIKIVETLRNEDKEQVRHLYGLSPKTEPVLDSIQDLRSIVLEKIKDEKIRDQCITYLDKIEKDYGQISGILMTGAEAGLNMSVAIHEIEKIISELKRVARVEKSPERVIKLIERLDEMIEMYAILVRKSGNKIENLKDLIEDALFNVQYRLKAHRIEIINEFSEFKGDPRIRCFGNLVIGAILNLIDNSIYWLERYRIKRKQILIALRRVDAESLEVLVADNGKGFALPPEQLLKPFVSLKPGGMGLGLHLASEIVSAQGGNIKFPNFKEIHLPRIFKNGAIISLIFKMNE